MIQWWIKCSAPYMNLHLKVINTDDDMSIFRYYAPGVIKRTLPWFNYHSYKFVVDESGEVFIGNDYGS
jgi:hypothetical protein